MNRDSSTPFSNFIRTATPEEKGRVYGEVMDRVADRQREVIAQASRSPEAWMWEHVDKATGRVLSCGLSFTKMEPTNDTFWDGKVATRVTRMVPANCFEGITASDVEVAAKEAGLCITDCTEGRRTAAPVFLDALLKVVRAAVRARSDSR